MDRRDFLKLFGLTVAGLWVPRRTYFDMGKHFASFRGEKLLIQLDGAPSVAQFANLRIASIDHDGGFMITPEMAPILDKFFKENSHIRKQFTIPITKQENVGSRQWLEDVKRMRE